MTAGGPARMEPIATLPVFLKLRGRRVVLAGGDAPAVWKAELLSAAGAHVTVLAPKPHEGLLAIAASPPDGPVHIERRPWTAADLPGAAVALGALEDDGEAAAFQAACKAAGVPVNVIDKPAFCEFQFGTIVSRSPLLIGISTDGAAPVFGQAIRARIEALLPQSLRAWAEAARDWRPAIQARELGFRARRRFWEVFAERALATPDGAPTATDREACMAAAVDATRPAARMVTLIGAGRGNPDGITLQAIKALQDADLVVHGTAISPVLVGFARREAAKIAIAEDDPDISGLVGEVFGTRRVVWLDDGNPSECRRWAARQDALSAAEIGTTLVEGLGLCRACTPDCPAWRA